MHPVAPKLGFRAVTYAKDQAPYLPLPAEHVDPGSGIIVVSRWRPTLLERLRFLFGHDLYWATRTFGHPLQAQRPAIGARAMIRFLNNVVTECA